jgi:hypothetical protein
MRTTIEDVQQFIPLKPRVLGRDNVREPLPGRIVVPLLASYDDQAEMRLTVPQALELATGIMTAVGEFCKRWDIAEALRRTDPLFCQDQNRS